MARHDCLALGYETAYRYLIHDRDSIFSVELDASVGNFGLRVLKIPSRSPMANGICERLIGTIRRECLEIGSATVNCASGRSASSCSCTQLIRNW